MMKGVRDKSKERVVEIRCGRRIFVSTSSTLTKDESSLLNEMYRDKAMGMSPGSLVQIGLPEELVEFLGVILRFYENGSLESAPIAGNAGHANDTEERFVRACKFLRVEQLLQRIGVNEDDNDDTQTDNDEEEEQEHEDEGEEEEAGEVEKVDDDEDAIFNSLVEKIENTKSMESEGAKAEKQQEESDDEDAAPDEEQIILQLMEKINERKSLDRTGAENEIPFAQSGDEEVDVEDLERKILDVQKQLQEMETNVSSNNESVPVRTLELKKVELQRLNYEKERISLMTRHSGKRLVYNLLVVGVTGTGKSSSLNSLLDKQVCRVSGSQGQGTRGCNLQDGFISEEHFVSFIDTQGLGADTSVTDTELLAQIMMSTESISRMKIINNILISFDTNTRATPATMANQLTLMELFGELRQSCFLILTKWNTNAVQCEWNTSLRQWTKKWRRARTIEEITDDPPSYTEMYESYCKYIMNAMNNDEDAGAFSKMGSFLSFFQSRVLFMFNLDAVQIEDLEAGELEPHIEKLYKFYREKALQVLHRGSTEVYTEELSFLKEDGDTLSIVASRLIENRDKKIEQLERIGQDTGKRKMMGDLFTDMTSENCKKIKSLDYDVKEETHMTKIAEIAGFEKESASVGCSVM